MRPRRDFSFQTGCIYNNFRLISTLNEVYSSWPGFVIKRFGVFYRLYVHCYDMGLNALYFSFTQIEFHKIKFRFCLWALCTRYVSHTGQLFFVVLF